MGDLSELPKNMVKESIRMRKKKEAEDLLLKPRKCIMGCGTLVVGNFTCPPCSGQKVLTS